jgi:hypothetical protein
MFYTKTPRPIFRDMRSAPLASRAPALLVKPVEMKKLIARGKHRNASHFAISPL